MSNFNGYSFFEDVKNPKLRTYNRINVYLNIKERHGKEVGRKYLKKFNKKEQFDILRMMSDIKFVGFEQYRRDFMRERNA